MNPIILAALIGGVATLLNLPVAVWNVRNLRRQTTVQQQQTGIQQQVADDGHLKTLLGLLDDYRTELTTNKSERSQLEVEIAANKQERIEQAREHERQVQALMLEVTKLRTEVDNQGIKLSAQSNLHTREMAALQEQYERRLGEKELQIVGLRGEVGELRAQVAGAGAELTRERKPDPGKDRLS